MVFFIVLSQAQVEEELTAADAEANKGPAKHKTGPIKFILMGLDLEDAQYVQVIVIVFNDY